jgi:hypothetical protein
VRTLLAQGGFSASGIMDIATNCGIVEPLTPDEIDSLCQSVVCSDDELRVWTMTADDESGLETSVHLTEAEAYENFVQQWKDGSVEGADHSKVDALLAAAIIVDDYEQLDDYLEDNIGAGSLDSFQVSWHDLKICNAPGGA